VHQADNCGQVIFTFSWLSWYMPKWDDRPRYIWPNNFFDKQDQELTKCKITNNFALWR